MNPHILGINIIWGMFLVHVYDHTNFCAPTKQKNGHKWYFGQANLWSKKDGTQTQLDFGISMGRIPPG